MNPNPVLHWTDHAGERQAWPLAKLQEEFKAFLVWRARQPAASGEPPEPFGYVITHNFPEGHAYRYSFYTPKSIGTAYRDTALSITPVFANAQPAPALVPLTDEQIDAIRGRAECWEHVGQRIEFRYRPFTRAIEAAHGIGTPAKEAP